MRHTPYLTAADLQAISASSSSSSSGEICAAAEAVAAVSAAERTKGSTALANAQRQLSGLQGFGYENNRLCYHGKPVCLDYLKGFCTLKRLKCKYSHPPLNSLVSESAQQHGKKACEVFLLTGFCKFGATCRDYHPPSGGFSPLCAPACTTRMTEQSKQVAGATAQANMVTAAAQSRPTPLDRATMLAINELLDNLSEDTFHSSVQALQRCEMHNPAATHTQCLPLLFARAVANPEKSDLYSKLCLYLHNLLSATERHAFCQKLTELCSKLLYNVSDVLSVFTDASEFKSLQSKRLGNACFIGWLFNHGVVPAQFVKDVLKFLCSRGIEQDDEGQFHIVLYCAVLKCAGTAVHQRQTITQLLQLATVAGEDAAAAIRCAMQSMATTNNNNVGFVL